MKKRTRFLTALLAGLMLSVFLAVPAFASGNIKSASTWLGYAEQLGPFDDADQMAKQLSAVAGSSKTKDPTTGEQYFTVVILGGSSGYYAGGAPVTSDGKHNVDTTLMSSHYDAKLDVTYGSSVGVYVCKYAGDTDLQRVNANVSSGLLSQAGVTPDTGTAMNLLTGIMPMINTLLGLIVTVISIGMTVFSALDIIYLAFPVFRDKVDAQVEGGGKGTKTNKDGSASSRWVSDDARNAVTETSTDQQQPWGAYFKKRVIAYIFLAIILFILLTGNIFSITTLVTGALSGLFSSLGLA